MLIDPSHVSRCLDIDICEGLLMGHGFASQCGCKVLNRTIRIRLGSVERTCFSSIFERAIINENDVQLLIIFRIHSDIKSMKINSSVVIYPFKILCLEPCQSILNRTSSACIQDDNLIRQTAAWCIKMIQTKGFSLYKKIYSAKGIPRKPLSSTPCIRTCHIKHSSFLVQPHICTTSETYIVNLFTFDIEVEERF